MRVRAQADGVPNCTSYKLVIRTCNVQYFMMQGEKLTLLHTSCAKKTYFSHQLNKMSVKKWTSWRKCLQPSLSARPVTQTLVNNYCFAIVLGKSTLIFISERLGSFITHWMWYLRFFDLIGFMLLNPNEEMNWFYMFLGLKPATSPSWTLRYHVHWILSISTKYLYYGFRSIF